MWMTPFYLFFGTLIIFIFKNYIKLSETKNFLYGFIYFFHYHQFLIYISLIKDDKRTDFPGKKISKKIQKSWDEEFNEPINIVLGDEWLAKFIISFKI